MDLAEVKAQVRRADCPQGQRGLRPTDDFGHARTKSQRSDTPEALRQGAPGGGFILSSSNSIHSAVKPENYRAMLDTWQEYRRYPLKLLINRR
jgi:uroporphyrinogen-III decarboxylase